MIVLLIAAFLASVIACAPPRPRGWGLIAPGLLLWLIPGVFVGARILSGLLWLAVS
jgi:hypothetical protein